MPAGGEMQAILQNKNILNSVLSKMVKGQISSGSYWTSSEYSNSAAWHSNSELTYKDGNLTVRPVIAF